MANVEKVSIALTEEMAAFVRQTVESGEYASHETSKAEALRVLGQEGIDSGPGQFETMEDIIKEAKRRQAAKA